MLFGAIIPGYMKMKKRNKKERDKKLSGIFDSKQCKTCIYMKIKPNIACNKPFDNKTCTWYDNRKWRFAGKFWSKKRSNILMFLYYYRNLRINTISYFIQYYISLHPILSKEELFKCIFPITIKKKELIK